MDVICIDARNAVYRHGWTRAQLHNSEGKPTGAIFGILSCLLRLYKYYPNAKFIFCWDGKEPKKSWRHVMCSTYKAHRHSANGGEMPVEVKNILSQIPAIKKVIALLGFQQYEVPYLEADDLIGIVATSLAKRKDVDRVLIYSMDKDYYQLITLKVQVLRDLDKANKCKAFTAEDVKKEFGVLPVEWNRYRALVGDKSDGINSAIPRVGKVTALKLLAQGFDCSKSAPVSKIEKLHKDHWQKAYLNYQLSKIVINPKSKYLLESSVLSLVTIIDSISSNKGIVRRNKKEFNATGYRQFLAFCANYELAWILENRYLFSAMGW